MKRILVLLLSLILLISVGCSSDEATESIEEVSQEETKEVEQEDEIDYTIGIEVEYNEHSSGNTHITIAGKTNLPDGEEVIISVLSEEHDYTGADTQEVKDGIYVSEPFSKQGESLPSGEYRVKVGTVETGKAEQEETIQIE